MSKNIVKLISIAILLTILVSLWWLRRTLHKYAVRRLALAPYVIGKRTPADFAMSYEEVWFQARDGVKLHAWYITPTHNLARNVTILMGHGHAGNKEPDLEYAHFLYEAGYNVFMFDFRAHGRSEWPGGSSLGYWERLDVHGAVDWLIGRGQARIGAFGISMGAAILVMATAENPFIRAVVADSPYAHLHDAIAGGLNSINGVPLWLARPLGRQAWQALAVYHHFATIGNSPADYVAQIAPRPLLLIHGEQDLLTSVTNSRLLYDLAEFPKEIWIEPQVTHAQCYWDCKERYQKQVLDFFERVDWQAEVVLTAPSHTLDGLKVS